MGIKVGSLTDVFKLFELLVKAGIKGICSCRNANIKVLQFLKDFLLSRSEGEWWKLKSSKYVQRLKNFLGNIIDYVDPF